MKFTMPPTGDYYRSAEENRNRIAEKTPEQLAEEERLQTYRQYRELLILAIDMIEKLSPDFTEREFAAEDADAIYRASSLVCRCLDQAHAIRLDWFEGRIGKAEGGGQ